MKILSKEINQIIKELISNIEKHNTGFNPYYDSMKRLSEGKAQIQDIVRLLESLSMAEEFINPKNNFLLMDYDELLVFISEKEKNEQSKIVETIHSYFSKYFIWETTDYHCVCKLESKTNNKTNDGEVQ